MSIQDLHDQLANLKDQADSLAMEEVERKQHLAEIVESLEEQIIEGSGLEVNAEVFDLIENKLLHFEVEHPKITQVLSSIMNTLKSMGI